MLRRLQPLAVALAFGIGLTCLGTPAEAATPRVTPTSAIERARVDTIPTPRLDWTPCEFGECARVLLPLDYDDPRGPHIEVALTRLRARDPQRRIGSLFLNPGGPGTSGTAFPQRATEWLGAEVRDRFDLIGMDPRGTNDSTNSRCFHSPQRLEQTTDVFTSLIFPATDSEVHDFTKASASLARACSTQGRRVASAMSTAQVARDMDVIRRAVGDEKLSFLGFSYGTYLGQVYANLFPDRVRALAIDGVVDPVAWVGTPATADTPMTVRMNSAAGSSSALNEVLRRCAAAAEACGVPEPEQTFARVADRLRQAPLQLDDPEAGPSTVTYQGFVSAAQMALYTEAGAETIPQLAAMLDQLQTPGLDRPARAQLSRDYRRTAEKATRRGRAYSNVFEQVPIVMCSDSRNPRHASEWARLAAAEDARAPYFGRYWLWGSVHCAGQTWTAKDEDAYAGGFDAVTSSPVLVVGNHWDPATNYAAARSVARLVPRSRLLSSNNWGHTAYGVSACATAHVDRYLIAGALPPDGTLCTDGHQPFTG